MSEEKKVDDSAMGGGHPRFYEILDQQAKLHNTKNTDYAKGGKQGALGNFVRVSSIMQLYPGMDWDSPFGVAICYMLKQLDAALILRSTKRDSITGEPIPARLLDVSTYSNIAMILVEEESTSHGSLASHLLEPYKTQKSGQKSGDKKPFHWFNLDHPIGMGKIVPISALCLNCGLSVSAHNLLPGDRYGEC